MPDDETFFPTGTVLVHANLGLKKGVAAAPLGEGQMVVRIVVAHGGGSSTSE